MKKVFIAAALFAALGFNAAYANTVICTAGKKKHG